MPLDGDETRLRGRGNACIEFFQPFAPPSEAHRSEQHLPGGAHHVAHRAIDREQSGERRPFTDRRVCQRQSKVGSEHDFTGK